MPQLEASTFISQLFWLAITFIGLYWVMWKVIIPRVADVLQDRQERIDDDLEKAEALRNEAAGVLEAYEKTVADGRARAQTILREAADRNDKAAAERQAALGEQLAQQTADAEARINAAREEALANIRSVAAETAQAAALRLSGATITQDEAEEAVASVLTEGR
jgi:F-type H+-transporting ATPase subunit b